MPHNSEKLSKQHGTLGSLSPISLINLNECPTSRMIAVMTLLIFSFIISITHMESTVSKSQAVTTQKD